MKVTEAQLDAAGVDQAWRDYCAHLLIPLNKCRRANLFAPWKCVDERHGYEKCQYDQYVIGVMLWWGVPWERQPGGTKGADCCTIGVAAGRRGCTAGRWGRQAWPDAKGRSDPAARHGGCGTRCVRWLGVAQGGVGRALRGGGLACANWPTDIGVCVRWSGVRVPSPWARAPPRPVRLQLPPAREGNDGATGGGQAGRQGRGHASRR